MTAEELTELQKEIVAKIYLSGYVGARQTMVDNVVKGFPKHLRGEVHKEMEKLMRRGWLLKHPTSYGRRLGKDRWVEAYCWRVGPTHSRSEVGAVRRCNADVATCSGPQPAGQHGFGSLSSNIINAATP
jgi:hypothetical protein